MFSQIKLVTIFWTCFNSSNSLCHKCFMKISVRILLLFKVKDAVEITCCAAPFLNTLYPYFYGRLQKQQSRQIVVRTKRKV